MATRTFREKSNNKAESFFRLTFNAYIDVDNRERATEGDKKQRRPNSSQEKQKNYSSGNKMRNTSGHQGENDRQ